MLVKSQEAVRAFFKPYTWKCPGVSVQGIHWNRQSSRTNAKRHHTEKLNALKKADKALYRKTGIAASVPFMCECNGSLRQLFKCDFFFSSNPVDTLPRRSYFYRVYRQLLKGLDSLQPNERLVVKVFSPDRLFRPFRFQHTDPETYEPLLEDFEIFYDFLVRCFGDRVTDLIFVSLHEGDWVSIKNIQSKLSQSNGAGGRPPKRKHMPKNIKSEAVQKAVSAGWNATQLVDYLGENSISKRQARRWLADVGASQRSHRPPAKKADIVSKTDSNEQSQIPENKEPKRCRVADTANE